MNPIEKARDAFEHWYTKGNKDCPSIQRTENRGKGELPYRLIQAQHAWGAWHAAWEAKTCDSGDVFNDLLSDKALEIIQFEGCDHAVFSMEDIERLREALRALRDMQEVDVEALKRKIASELSYIIPHSYSDNTMLNTVDWISQNYNLIPKE